MYEVKHNGQVVARHIKPEDIKPGLNFFSQDGEYIQVGVWGQYENGKELAAHIHNTVERKADRTYEALYVISGALKAVIYDMEEHPIDTLTVSQGEILILLECGHGYTILEDNTNVLEIKNGPYLGAEVDRRRI